MPKTLLVVDDSATMRKVLEITFAGDDFRVVAADGASSALGRMGEDPVAVVIDTSLGGDDGYALAKEMRSRSAKLAVVLMASRYNPYDPNRGKDAGVDDFVDKPFDTQILIDKVKKAVTTREAARPAAPPAPPPAAHPVPFSTTASFGSQSRPAAVPPSAAGPGAKPAQWGVPRTHTLSFEGALPIVPAPIISPTAAAPPRQAPTAAPAPPPAPPAPPAAAAAPPPAAAAVSAAAPAVNGQFSRKLAELGLTPAQADAVLSLSRELLERVVWEVVPQMAETLIKEEIARLTKEG